jgi:oxygen-independent coproporphyrinogen III oxidase
MHSDLCISGKLQSIYFWWWTPSILNIKQLKAIVDVLQKKYNFSEDIEITLESTPNKITKPYLKNIKNIWINRVSIWIQSLNEKTLKEIWRWEKWNVLKSLDYINEVGIKNISIDMIIWLPYVKKWEINKGIKFLLDRFPSIKHLSLYMLEDYYEIEAKEKSKFHSITYPNDWKNLWISLTDYKNEYLQVSKLLEEYWFHRYEISNFSKPWYECKHNKAYWSHQEVLAFWLWSSWFIDGKRYTNSDNFLEYYSRKNIFKELLTPNDIFKEKIMFWFRTWGITWENKKYLNKKNINTFIENWFIKIDPETEFLQISDKWVLVLDHIIKEII